MIGIIVLVLLVAWLVFDLFIADAYQNEEGKEHGREEKERKTKKEGHQSEH